MANENEQGKRKTLNEIVAELRMGDDGGKPAYRIGRADKVDVSMPSGTPVRSYVIECVTIKELADWIEAAVARERGSCNAAAMREALEKIYKLMTSDCPADEVEIANICFKALSEPARNCDRPECATSKAAQDVWRKEDGGGTPYYEWLLAPAAERKGEGDGR